MNIIKKFPEDMDAKTLYKLVKTPYVKRMVDAEDSVLSVGAWLLFEDEEKRVLVISTADGEIFATISNFFIKEFEAITEIFGDDVGEIKVISGKSRAGRKFITCSLV